MHTTVRAAVLREVKYKEADKILTLLTGEMGKVTVTARGCRRKSSPLSAACQQLVYGEFVLYEYQGRWGVKEASTLRQFRGLFREVERVALAGYFAELTELLTQEELPAGEVLSLFLNSLHALDQGPWPREQVKAAFELKLLALAGYEPLVDACAVCGREPERPMLHLSQGVLHCDTCREAVGEGISMPLTPGGLAALRHILWGDHKRLFSFRLDPQSLGQLGDLAEAYLAARLERGFRTLDLYKQLTAEE